MRHERGASPWKPSPSPLVPLVETASEELAETSLRLAAMIQSLEQVAASTARESLRIIARVADEVSDVGDLNALADRSAIFSVQTTAALARAQLLSAKCARAAEATREIISEASASIDLLLAGHIGLGEWTARVNNLLKGMALLKDQNLILIAQAEAAAEDFLESSRGLEPLLADLRGRRGQER